MPDFPMRALKVRVGPTTFGAVHRRPGAPSAQVRTTEDGQIRTTEDGQTRTVEAA